VFWYSAYRQLPIIHKPPRIGLAGCLDGSLIDYGGMSFWVRGYFVSTVGADEEVVRGYIGDHEKEDHRLDQLSLFK
jgi:putative transposase